MITKKALGKFDSIEFFSDEYLKVSREGKFNLIDRDGRYASASWFDSIEKREASIDITDGGKTMRMSSPAGLSGVSSLHTLLSDTSVLSRVDLSCISLVAAYSVRNRSGRMIRIIAEVRVLGRKLFLSDDGRLWDDDYCEFEMPEFNVSDVDINRLCTAAGNICKRLNYNYNEGCLGSTDTHRKEVGFWTFGFGTRSYLFISHLRDRVGVSTTKPWGMNGIKLRFAPDDCNAVDKDRLTAVLKDRGYLCWESNNWYTREFPHDQVSEAIAEMNAVLAAL